MSRLGAVRPLLLQEWTRWMSCIWLHLLLVLVVARGNGNPANVAAASTADVRKLQENFRFTHHVYNGTVPENAVGKVYVKTPVKMGIYLPQSLTSSSSASASSFSSPSSHSPIKVNFVILGRDAGRIFHAESVMVEDFCFMRVRTKTGAYGMLNREHRQQYYFRVRATGSLVTGALLEAETDVNITLLDQNEFSPLFPDTPFAVSVAEDTPLHSSIARVRASDAEVGINGEIYYSIVDPPPMFAIHPTSGVVSLMRPLRHQPRSYDLKVHAEDRGLKTSSRSSPLSDTSLEVTVLPVNYHAPVVHVQKLPTLREDAAPGSVFAVLKVTDPDDGLNGVVASVGLAEEGTAFRVVRTPTRSVYNVVVAAPLDREASPKGFNISVTAEDRAMPPKSTTVVIPVVLQDVNDNAPVFEEALYRSELLEVVPIRTPVLFVNATDADAGRNGEVRYRLKDEDASDQFSIDEVTGLISTAALLDTEMENRINLVVYAEDRANGGTRLTGETKVVIEVKDFNDNAPKFDHNSLKGVFINENMPKGTPVVTFTATDPDSGDNGRVSYSIHSADTVPFEIDAFTGQLKTTEVFDFETSRKQFLVVVRASDWGSPYKHWTQQPVVIHVQDANDNSPEFEKTRCKGYLSREAPPGTKMVILTAIDFDAGNIITYSISEGNDDGCFSINPDTGAVMVACDLTSYAGETRDLTVVASDGVHLSVPTTVSLRLVNSKRSPQSATAEVSVTCQDTDVARRLQEQMTKSQRSNEKQVEEEESARKAASSDLIKGQHAPQFAEAFPSYITVSEGAAVGSVVFKASAKDQDVGYAGQVLYVLSQGNVGGSFKIDTFSGEVKVFSSLDHETKSEYNLTITAQGLGDSDRSVSRILKIFVSDENDNAPQFEQAVYEKSIFEDVQVNATVIQVFATDKDTGLNARISYSLVSHMGDFYVEPGSGIVRVKAQLDREKKATYHLLVQAEDSGLHRKLSSTATVVITLNDINDNFPEFVPKMQTVRVREDLPVGTVVTTLTAHDLDEGANGLVTYKLVDGADDKFHVDELTGAVRILKKLDFETTQVYNLSVRAEDGGNQSLVSMCLLNVEVVDVNENHYAPEFKRFLERGSVAENSPVGTYVMGVRAFDKDDASTNGGRITYSIRDGSGLGRFSIDANGTIRTRQVLHRETASHYWLTVYAQDSGLVPQFGRLEVLVIVDNVNDNVPQSLEPAYYASVREESRTEQTVVKVKATDGDRDPWQELRFDITGGNPQNFFRIDPLLGTISTTNRVLDREQQEEHALEVTISDNGSPRLSSTTRVVIKVVDINDHKPRFLDRVRRFSVLAQKKVGPDIFIYRTVAHDKDEGPNAELTYTMKDTHDSQFYIDSKTGEIFSRKGLNAGEMFDLVIRALDNGADRKKTQQKMRLTVVAPPESSPHAPRFVQRGLMETITESDTPGRLIVLLSAEDEDRGDRLSFAIEGGNEDKVFTIQPNHGSILLASPVDWETRSSYNLTVSVTDGVHKDFTWLEVEVLDVNDHEPVFSHQLYRANISENCPVGRHVLRVSASDRDKDNRLLYSIASAASIASLDKFEIGPMNGVIMVSKKLDREEMPRHLLTIMVRDQGVPSKKSFARVEIDVEDDNDHTPQFLSKRFEGRVFETTAIGSNVVQVLAMDQDKGSNSEITYSILSGNADNTFAMDERQGIISVAKQLDRAMQPIFHLVTMATDHGMPPRSSTAEVTITVTVSNNAPPKFANKEIVTELKENLPSGTVLNAVHAESQSTVVYTIIAGNDNDYFFLNPNSGVVSTTRPVDFEQFRFFNLTILASNIVGATATAHLLVHVDDENDNRPEFAAEAFYGNISEAAEPGSMVLTKVEGSPLVITASDADSGENSLLSFEIVEEKAKQSFTIDPNTGAIRTLVSLDHETTEQMSFTVQVHDRGNPPLSARTPAQVTVYISDVNDTPPHFDQHMYEAKVLLPTYHDVTVMTVEAVDLDTVGSMPLTYSIMSGNHGNIFAINPQSGVLHVERVDNMEDRYELKVQASDGRFNTLATVVITVEQSTNSGLRFTKDRYSATVQENSAKVNNLVAVQPVGEAFHQHLNFQLLNNQELFTIGETSGILQTKGVPFDREKRENYTVVVQVTDASPEPITAHVVVLVTVLDENDSPPMFVKQPFQTIVSSNAERGDVVKKVTATDEDLGENGELRYFLPAGLTDNGKDRFAINQYTGDIVVRELTEDDRDAHFLLSVEAVDRGTPPLSTTVEVPIHVVDSSSPVFESAQTEVQIPESMPIHSFVLSLQAISPMGQKLIYSIVSGDRYGDFAVDFNTDMEDLGPCLVSVAGHLDRESQDRYDLVVRASDVDSAIHADTRLTIILEDVNDNAPVFVSLRYTHTVSEVARIGTSILQVTAQDADQAANSLIHYSLAPTSPDSTDDQPFFINSETGDILLHRPLDREVQAEYTFLAVATDSGMPARSSTAVVHIVVIDLNDNAPQFTQPSFNCYITDQAQRGQLVTKVIATDADDSNKGQLAYSIIGGNEKQAFDIDPISGLVTVAAHRKPDFSPAYVLNVSVSDGVYTSFSRVAIGVRNTNRHAPRFTEQQYHVEVSEMIAVGSSVITVTAMDADRGNYGMLTYTLPSQNMLTYFSVDADTGELTTRQILDREKHSRFEVTVAATDNGGQMSFATVTVTVKDENDNVPQFLKEEYQANIHFNATLGAKVIQVKAHDADLGANGRVHYMLHRGDDPNVGQLFEVDEENGHITVKSSLTFAENKVYQFFVRAKDQGQPALENHVPVEILVMGANEAPPVFPTEHSSFFIHEDEEPGGIIATVRAHSAHPLTYTIVPGMTISSNNPAFFSIDRQGQIRILKALDRETTPTFTLAIKAQTRSSPPLVAHTEVRIQLRDINDNPPVFESNPYTATVMENTEVGKDVIQIKAMDADLPRKLEYSFGPGMEFMANIFAVDANTGWISLLSKLDRETTSQYNLTLAVTDSDDETRISGKGVRLTSTTHVIITVTDYNDNAPRFDKEEFTTAVNEGALPVILSLTSTDKDTGVNADVTYYIVKGDPLGQFEIHSTGELFVNKPLDRESRAQYHLEVAATDGAFVSFSKVTVTVLDDNDNAPECLEPFVDVIENEDVSMGKPLAHIQATDKDEASTINARIQYTLSGEGAEKFTLDKDSGVLRTAMALDRETQQQYHLVATATDGGGLSCLTEIRVFLRDVNDNPPEFTDSFRDTLTVQEDARVNTLLTRVTTVDRDTGINRNTRYRLMEMNPTVFSIDQTSGILSLVGTLDREQNPEYNVTVIAYNEISPELSAAATLRVVVLDVNDNPPTFERTSYSTAISEGATVDSTVARVRASSLDIGANAAITYTIAAGNQQGKFTIEPSTGIIRVAEPLDHELSREYFLTILARDHGSPPLSNMAIVSINITDVNDNPPLFSQDTYSTTVNELAQRGTEVFKVLATDADSYANSVITYSIIDGSRSPDGNFVIGPHDGVIQITKPLDRELVETFVLTIQARDSGNPMLYSTAIVSIVVEDANDNAPQFDNSSYVAQVQEGRRTGIEIMKFKVTDSDSAGNGPPFTFDIIDGNDDGEFHVDHKGVLYTAGKLSKQVKEQYQLTVRVFDNGTPPLHSDTSVTVHVVDDSVYPPEVRNLSIHISSCMDAFPGGVIGQIEARDRDPYDTLSFNIVSPNRHLFDVHRDDGRLIALTGLDEGEYIVNISVTDQKYTRFGRVLVTVVCVSKEIVKNAVTIQFADMIPEQFYASYRKDFQQLVKRKLNVRLNDVEIINVQPSSDTIQATSNNNHYRVRRGISDNNLDVLFAVRKSLDRFYNPRSLKRKVQKFADELEQLGIRVLRVFSDVCTKTTCEIGTCVGSVEFDDSNLVPVVVNGESFVSARHYYTHECVCLEEGCKMVLCGDQACQAFEVCSQDVFGDPMCQCPEGRNGPQCQNIIPLCSGSKCPVERPMTFSGKSYAKWTLGHPTLNRMSLSLRFRTRQTSAILMYAKGQVDYSILAIEDGSLVYRFNCGSGEGQVWVPVDLSDGQWHRVSVERTGRLAEILLDEAYTAMGTAPGVHEVLNLDSEEVFFGAKVDVLLNGYRAISKGFEGCMEDIRMFNVPLPLTGSNDIAHSQEFEVVEFHCKDTISTAISPSASGATACSNSPCLNGGVCQLSGLNKYMCLCRDRFKGLKCEVDTDPCQDSPCHNKGQCRVDPQGPNLYTCRCPSNLMGMRCTYGFNCRPNPCLHGGTCIEGPTSALCHCAPGFAGLYCDKTIDACDSAPCHNDGTCQALAGGRYQCNCSGGFGGKYCEVVDRNFITSHNSPSHPITSTASGISAEEIYGIIGVIAGIVLLVLMFVLWRVWRRRKRDRRRANVTPGIARDNSEVMLNGMMKDLSSDLMRKVSNPDLSIPIRNIPSQPPPVPNRPVSYTPSTHDSLNVLNNLDSVRNYGSAADELETTGVGPSRRQHLPDFSEYLASFSAAAAGPRSGGGGSHSRPSNASSSGAPSIVPLHHPSNPPSDTESLQKAPWEFEYPNILGSYEDDKHRDNLAKHMPGLHSPMINNRPLGKSACGAPDASSISSLPVSESEDDLNVWRAKKKGYHWDTSDWAPRPSLPNISEIPANEVADSGSNSSSPATSYEGNNPIENHPNIPAMASVTASGLNSMTQGISAIPDPDYMTDSEYVGETENELDFDEDREDEMDLPPPSYADLPSYDQLLSLRDLNESYELPQNLNVHPDQYLPSYYQGHNFDQDSLGGGGSGSRGRGGSGGAGGGVGDEEENGNVSDEQNNEVDLAVAQSVAERTARRQPPGRVFLSPGYVTSGEYTTDAEPPPSLSRASFIDDMSMSVGGYTSNASCSDISGLCEIEDSEINASDEDDDDDDDLDNDENSPCLPSHLHTQV